MQNIAMQQEFFLQILLILIFFFFCTWSNLPLQALIDQNKGNICLYVYIELKQIQIIQWSQVSNLGGTN